MKHLILCLLLGLSLSGSAQSISLTVDSTSIDRNQDSAYVGQIITLWIHKPGNWTSSSPIPCDIGGHTISQCTYTQLSVDSNFVWRIKTNAVWGLGWNSWGLGTWSSNNGITVYWKNTVTGIQESNGVQRKHSYTYYDLQGRLLSETPPNALYVRIDGVTNERKLVYIH
jgi:hypothetical protein